MSNDPPQRHRALATAGYSESSGITHPWSSASPDACRSLLWAADGAASPITSHECPVSPMSSGGLAPLAVGEDGVGDHGSVDDV
jgi:hypothetical protein